MSHFTAFVCVTIVCLFMVALNIYLQTENKRLHRRIKSLNGALDIAIGVIVEDIKRHLPEHIKGETKEGGE